MLHEFTHLKHYDLPLNWVMCMLQAMHWFNPLLWFAFARMRADRELACDARVLSIDATDRRAEYGGALLKLQCMTPTHALSLGTTIKYLCDQTNHSYTVDAYAVILSPRLDADGHPVMPKTR